MYSKGLYVEKINSTESRVSMCCYQSMSPQVYTNIDFDNNDYLIKLRNDAESGEKIPECQGCWTAEKFGIKSYRQGQIESFNFQNIPVDKTVELISLLYNCENTCNLKCITCGPRYSSAWRQEYQKLNKLGEWDIVSSKQTSLKNDISCTLDLSKTKLIHFQGGEPLLTKDHEAVLQQALDQHNLTETIVSYNTNGTVFPSANTQQLWKNAKLVKLYFSIDAIKDQFEYVRYPGNWQAVEENLLKIKNTIPNVWIEIGVTVGLANIFYLKDILDWREANFNTTLSGDPIGIYFNLVSDIEPGTSGLMKLENASGKIKDQALEYIDSLRSYSNVTGINEMKNALIDATENNKWIDFLNQLDKIRNTNWNKSLSKLHRCVTI